MAGGAGPPKSVVGADLPRGRFIICFSLVCSLFFLWGLSYGLLDSLNKKFQNQFGISKAESTGLQGVYFGAYFVFSIPASFIIRKLGYQRAIVCFLSLFGTAAILFWPCGKAGSYPGFLVCTFFCACGLAGLEVSANTYVAVLVSQHASLALTFAQAFNGISAFAGPLIASRWFFSGAHQDNLNSVQYVYLAVGLFGFSLAVLFFFAPFPEVRQIVTEEEAAVLQQRSYWDLFKRPRLMFGFVAEMLYVGAQVAVASLAINYFVETTNVSDAQAANLFSYCQMAFMAGRFLSVPVLHVLHPTFVLGVYGAAAAVFAILVSQVSGIAGAAMLFMVFSFESICYPVIFAEATLGLGPFAANGGAFIAMGVAGGAWYPSLQATLADHKTTQESYILPMVGFVAVSVYGFGLWIASCRANGFHVRRIKPLEDDSLRPAEIRDQKANSFSDSDKRDEAGLEHV